MLGQTAGLSAGVDLAGDRRTSVPAWSASRWSSIVAVLVISRGIRRCWNSMPSRAQNALEYQQPSSKRQRDVCTKCSAHLLLQTMPSARRCSASRQKWYPL
jgi:hypothetical protein